ncbi:MAG: glycosyltransferase family 4 protein [Anaerolineae bacterium]|nr:glycosyltransferase family 4 protein [Anaerolineae bacterium]
MPILEAFLEITQRFPRVKAFVGGGGPNKEQYETWLKARPGAEHVKFIGVVPDEDLPGLYASTDIFVSATHGYVSLEAMASGAATILVNHEPQTHEFVDHEAGGLLVEEKTHAVTQALEMLIHEPERRQRLSQGGRQFVLEGFENRRGTEEMIAFFEQVLHHAAGAPKR